jgi:hypothetical protein
MEKLAITFRGTGEVKGIIFTQLFRFEDLCLYERSDKEWEVIKVRPQKAKTQVIAGVTVNYAEKENYPRGESWGQFEYCCNSLERAIERFNQQAAWMGYSVVLSKEMLVYPGAVVVQDDAE